VGLAFVLGALHALTPGHGKGALAAYFLGQDAKLGTGLRVTLTASFLHVLMGALVFVGLRFVVSQFGCGRGRSSTCRTVDKAFHDPRLHSRLGKIQAPRSPTRIVRVFFASRCRCRCSAAPTAR
jgi:hypothetical protein